MKIKEIPRSATVAWSPSPQAPSLIACGTVAGAIDSSFSVRSYLSLPTRPARCSSRIAAVSRDPDTQVTGTIDIFDINLGTNDLEVVSKGSVEADERFHRLAWGNFTAGDAYPYGLLAGGMVDGSVQVLFSFTMFHHHESRYYIVYTAQHVAYVDPLPMLVHSVACKLMIRRCGHRTTLSTTRQLIWHRSNGTMGQ